MDKLQDISKIFQRNPGNSWSVFATFYQYLKNQAVMKKVEKKSDSNPKNYTKGTDLLYVVHFEQFNQEIGQTFPANFDEQRVTPKDYFDLMLR